MRSQADCGEKFQPAQQGQATDTCAHTRHAIDLAVAQTRMWGMAHRWVILNCLLAVAALLASASCQQRPAAPKSVTVAPKPVAAAPSSTDPQTHSLDLGHSDSPKFTVTIPGYYALTRRDGPDYVAYYFARPNAKGNAGIYLGYFPNLISRQARGIIQSERAIIAGAPAQWNAWEQDGWHFKELLVKEFFGSGDSPYAKVVVHMFIGFPDAAECRKLQSALGTLSLVK